MLKELAEIILKDLELHGIETDYFPTAVEYDESYSYYTFVLREDLYKDNLDKVSQKICSEIIKADARKVTFYLFKKIWGAPATTEILVRPKIILKAITGYAHNCDKPVTGIDFVYKIDKRAE